jgi:hypothetical protein
LSREPRGDTTRTGGVRVMRRLRAESRREGISGEGISGTARKRPPRRGGLKGNARLSEDRYPRSQLRLCGRDAGDSMTQTGGGIREVTGMGWLAGIPILQKQWPQPTRSEPELTAYPVHDRSALKPCRRRQNGAIDLEGHGVRAVGQPIQSPVGSHFWCSDNCA